MKWENKELYNSVYASFIKHREVETPEDRLFVHEITLEALEGIYPYIDDLEECIKHLTDTIKRLSKETSLDD